MSLRPDFTKVRTVRNRTTSTARCVVNGQTFESDPFNRQSRTKTVGTTQHRTFAAQKTRKQKTQSNRRFLCGTMQKFGDPRRCVWAQRRRLIPFLRQCKPSRKPPSSVADIRFSICNRFGFAPMRITLVILYRTFL